MNELKNRINSFRICDVLMDVDKVLILFEKASVFFIDNDSKIIQKLDLETIKMKQID
jgi:hypothetical protein